MKQFFKEFWRKNKGSIVFFSLLRVLSFAQVLFWPYAFSKVVNILSNEPENWEMAFYWAGAMIINKVAEDFVRIKAKYEIEKISNKLQIELATFCTENTELREGRKTGESVQAIKKAYEYIDSMLDFYRNKLLKLPVDFIIIPIILWRANISYLVLLSIYVVSYLVFNYFLHRIYHARMKGYLKAAEVFWGTAYRKAPEVWREREDGYVFADQVEKEGEDLFIKQTAADRINMWRWALTQAYSSAFIGGVVLFVAHKIISGVAPLGTLVLVVGYFREIQTTLGVITTAFNNFTQVKLSLSRLSKSVKIRGE